MQWDWLTFTQWYSLIIQLSCRCIATQLQSHTHYLHREFRVHTVFTQPSYSCRKVVEAMQSRVSQGETSTLVHHEIIQLSCNLLTLRSTSSVATLLVEYSGYSGLQWLYNDLTNFLQSHYSCNTVAVPFAKKFINNTSIQWITVEYNSLCKSHRSCNSSHTSSVSYAIIQHSYNSLATCLHRDFRIHTVICNSSSIAIQLIDIHQHSKIKVNYSSHTLFCNCKEVD